MNWNILTFLLSLTVLGLSIKAHIHRDFASTLEERIYSIEQKIINCTKIITDDHLIIKCPKGVNKSEQ